SWAGTIAAGNLVLVRVGDGAAALAGSGTAGAVFLDEYTQAGVPVPGQSLPMPPTQVTTAGLDRALTVVATGNTEGHLTLSGDGQYFIMAGYNQTVGTTGTNTTLSTAVERVIGRMDFNGNINTKTALVDAMSGQPVRSAYS